MNILRLKETMLMNKIKFLKKTVFLYCSKASKTVRLFLCYVDFCNSVINKIEKSYETVHFVSPLWRTSLFLYLFISKLLYKVLYHHFDTYLEDFKKKQNFPKVRKMI